MSPLQTFWKISTNIRRYVTLPATWLYFTSHGVKWNKQWRIYGCPLIQRHLGSEIFIGEGFQMRNWFSSNPLGVNHRSILATWAADAEIRIGDRVGLTGSTICAQTSIIIGNNVRIGANSTIIDTDFHPIDPEMRLKTPQHGASAPVSIGDNVFIGTNVLILKNTIIGDNTVVGAGSVVTGKIPARVVIAGNPARILKEV